MRHLTNLKQQCSVASLAGLPNIEQWKNAHNQEGTTRCCMPRGRERKRECVRGRKRHTHSGRDSDIEIEHSDRQPCRHTKKSHTYSLPVVSIPIEQLPMLLHPIPTLGTSSHTQPVAAVVDARTLTDRELARDASEVGLEQLFSD